MYDALHPGRTRMPALATVRSIVAGCIVAGGVTGYEDVLEEWVAAWRHLKFQEFEQDTGQTAS